MAILSLCGRLGNGLDLGCIAPTRKYFQQIVLINKSDIAEYTINKPDPFATPPVCAYNVEFTLKEGTIGYRISGVESGSTFFGSFDKSKSELGFAQYVQNVQILMVGVSEEVKCIQDQLDKGSFVAAMQLKNGIVEIFGLENGLTTGDYSYNIQEGGGGVALMLSSLENSPESSLPLIYKSATLGGENADFDALFENAIIP